MELNRAASAAETILREAMRGSPDTLRAFEAYLIAVGEQQSTVTEQIFESATKQPCRCCLSAPAKLVRIRLRYNSRSKGSGTGIFLRDSICCNPGRIME